MSFKKNETNNDPETRMKMGTLIPRYNDASGFLRNMAAISAKGLGPAFGFPCSMRPVPSSYQETQLSQGSGGCGRGGAKVSVWLLDQCRRRFCNGAKTDPLPSYRRPFFSWITRNSGLFVCLFLFCFVFRFFFFEKSYFGVSLLCFFVPQLLWRLFIVLKRITIRKIMFPCFFFGF